MIKVEEDIVETTVIPAGKYASMKEYSENTGQSYQTIRKKVSLGKLPSVILNGRRLVLWGRKDSKKTSSEVAKSVPDL